MPGQTHTSLSIAVVCYHSTTTELLALINSLLTAVEHIRTTLTLPPIPVYLLDNTEQPSWSLDVFQDLQGELDTQQLQLRLRNDHGNLGYGSAHNLVLNELDSEFHLLLNPDIVLQEDSLSAGISYLLDHADAVMASPHATGDDGNKQYLCKTYPALLTFLVRGFMPGFVKRQFAKRLGKFEMRHLSETEPGVNVPIISGCFMLCRTALLQGVGGFDENYFLYFEDFDLSLRMGTVGSLVYLPAMRIRHSGGHAASKGVRHLLMFFRSGVRFFSSHGWRLYRQD